jgi:hypothetical protein
MKKIQLILFVSFCFTPIFGQDNLEKLTDWTQNKIPESKNLLYTGMVYKNNYSGSDDTQHPFLSKKNFEKNQIKYSDFTFYNIYLDYDIEKDIVLANPNESEQTFYPVALQSEKVSYFFIDNKKFLNLNKSGFILAKNTNLNLGFAEEVVISNDATLFIKTKKVRKELKKDLKIVVAFDVSQEYFVAKSNTLYAIQSDRDLLSAYPTKQVAIQSYSEKNKLQKNSNFRQFLTSLLQQLETNNE